MISPSSRFRAITKQLCWNMALLNDASPMARAMQYYEAEGTEQFVLKVHMEPTS